MKTDPNRRLAMGTYLFVQTDGGRANSKYNTQVNDQDVRALAIACGITYTQAYELLRHRQDVSVRNGFVDTTANAEIAGFKFIWRAFPTNDEKRRIGLSNFCKKFSSGVSIVKIENAIFAVRDGVVFDEHSPAGDSIVHGCWEIFKLPIVGIEKKARIRPALQRAKN